LIDAPNAAGEIVNIGQPNEIRILDLARRIVELTESSSEIKLVPYDAEDAYGSRAAGYEDMRRRVPDTSKLRALTGFVPSITLDQTIREVIDYYLASSRERVPQP
jgi:UDP-glucose 4-epimerase